MKSRQVQWSGFVLGAALLGGAPMHAQSLLIAPGDLVHMQVADTPEMQEEARVTDTGEIPVVGIGEVKIAGLAPADAASAIKDQLVSAHYLNHPEVTVSVEQYATQNISIIGEVKSSGVYSINTSRPALDVIALAGGLTPEADRHILIERQGDTAHPVPYFLSNNAQNAIGSQVMINPGDTIVVPRSGIVYILGDVNRPGGYVMSNNESQLTLLQGLALAGGITRAAKQQKARLIRREQGGSFHDLPLVLDDYQKGKRADIALEPGDVLYVPFSYARNVATTGAAGIVSAATSASIYAIP